MTINAKLRTFMVAALSAVIMGCGATNVQTLSAPSPPSSDVTTTSVAANTTTAPETTTTITEVSVATTSAPETTQTTTIQIPTTTRVPTTTAAPTTTQAPPTTVAATSSVPDEVEVEQPEAEAEDVGINDLSTLDDLVSATRVTPYAGETEANRPPGNQIFAYAPATVFVGQHEHTFYCGNTAKTNGSVVDSIMLDDGQKASEVMKVSKGKWDSAHVCDPDVVEGNFSYDGDQYRWAMTYTGTKDPRGLGHENQVGLAFSNNLRNWTKYPTPIVTYSGQNWGVGQPSLVSTDKSGQVLLFYTQSDPVTQMSVVHLDLSDMTNGPRVLRPAWKVPTAGLFHRSYDGALALHNGEMAYDEASDRFVVIRPLDFNLSAFPGHIATSLQVAQMSGKGIWSGTGTWSSVTVIAPETTGYAKNHNGGIVTDTYGNIRDPQKLHLKFTGTPLVDTRQYPFWWYRIYEIHTSLPAL